MMNEGGILYAMTYRQLKRYFRAKSRLIGTIINPLIFFLFLGMGWSFSLRGGISKQLFGGIDYLAFLAPGITVMTIFTSSLIGGISVIWDREFGFLKEVLVAPASRTYAILGRALGDSLTSVLQGAIVLAMMYFMVPGLKLEGSLPVLVLGLVTALTFNGLGIAIASKMRSPEGFQLIMSLITLPLIFLSGAFYPIDKLPSLARVIFYINPLTFAVDATRYYLTGINSIPLIADVMILLILCAAFLAISIRIFERSTIE